MADTKISQLPAATTPLSGAEVVPLVQSGATVQTPVNDISLLTAATANTFTAVQTFTASPIISVTDNTNAALRVTQLGTGNAILVEDSTNPDSTPFVVTAAGDVGIGTSTPTDGNIHINGGSGAAALKLTNTATGQTVSDGFYCGIESVAGGAFIFQRENQPITFGTNNTSRAILQANGDFILTSSGGLGYGTGSGGAVTQLTSRTTGVTLNKTNGSITLFNAANSTAFRSFTVTNSTVAATDVILLSQKSGTNIQQLIVSNVAAGSFEISHATTTGSTTEAPVINFAVIKAVIS